MRAPVSSRSARGDRMRPCGAMRSIVSPTRRWRAATWRRCCSAKAASTRRSRSSRRYTRSDVELKRAYVLSRAGRVDDATRAIAASLRLDGTNGAAHAFAGQLALAAGDGERAAHELETARTLA